MLKRTIRSMLFVCIFLSSLFAQEVTKVLQNGTDGYSGFIDTYNFSLFADFNFKDDETFYIYNCPT